MAAGVAMAVGAAVAFWFSGLRGSGASIRILYLAACAAYLLSTVRKLRSLATFELTMDPEGEGLLLDGVRMVSLAVTYRGRLAFLRFEPKAVRVAWLGDAVRRREFRLALVHWNTTLRNQSMAP